MAPYLYGDQQVSPPTQRQQLRLNFPSAVFLGLCHIRFMPTCKCITFLFRNILPTLVIFGCLSITAHLCGRHWNCWTVLPPVCPASSSGWTSSESEMSKWEGKWSLELDAWGLELVGWWWGGPVSQSILATRTEHHPLGGWSTVQISHHSPGSWKSEIREPVWLGTGKSCLQGCYWIGQKRPSGKMLWKNPTEILANSMFLLLAFHGREVEGTRELPAAYFFCCCFLMHNGHLALNLLWVYNIVMQYLYALWSL